MYITAKLPKLYGAFNQIRRDNYPFARTFTNYLETIAALGLKLGLDADVLVGVIEDALLKDMRLPDIPEGDEKVEFRYAVTNSTIEEYFAGSELTHKMVVMLVIRMTLRLSAQFGTSLSRLTQMVAGIGIGEREVSVIREPEAPKIRITRREPAAEPVKDIQPELVEKPEAPVKEPEAHEEEPKGMLERLKDLTERGDALLAGEEDTPVVTTNPFLNDFL